MFVYYLFCTNWRLFFPSSLCRTQNFWLKTLNNYFWVQFLNVHFSVHSLVVSKLKQYHFFATLVQHNISGRAHIISVSVQKPIILRCKCCCRYFFPTQPLGQFSLLLKPLKPLYPLLTFSLNISHQPINNSRLNSLGKKKSHWNTPTTERRNEKQFCFFFATNKRYHCEYGSIITITISLFQFFLHQFSFTVRYYYRHHQ